MLNFGEKSCKIIHGEKTTCRVINILTKKIPYVLRKILKFLRDLIFLYKKQICHVLIKDDLVL